MNHTEMLSALEMHGRRNREEAKTLRQKAKVIKDDADMYARQHVGESMREKRAQIWHQGEVESQALLDEADRHDERASTAENGYLLHRNDLEARDPNYAMSLQPLIAAAGHHGVLTQEVM